MSAATLLGSSRGALTRFEIQPILAPTLPDVAGFLFSYAHRDQSPANERPLREDLLSTARYLRWLFVENPLAAPTSQHGLCICDASGVIRGLLLSFPHAFLAGDQRLVGLGSGGYFVEPQARTTGFYLFKRHLSAPDYSFFFSTTCNFNSGALWRTLGGRAVPNSDMEYIVPFKLEVLLPALLAKKTSSVSAANIARVAGRWANRVFRPRTRNSTKLRIEPCRDWEKLAALFRRHRDADVMTTDRSAVFLQWRYGWNAPNQPFDIRMFRDTRGHEGWFALGSVTRGRQGQIRGCVLLDAVWPRETMSFETILPAILQVAASRADALYFRSRPGLTSGECGRRAVPWRLEGPKGFVISRKGAPVAVSALDLVPADGDGAF